MRPSASAPLGGAAALLLGGEAAPPTTSKPPLPVRPRSAEAPALSLTLSNTLRPASAQRAAFGSGVGVRSGGSLPAGFDRAALAPALRKIRTAGSPAALEAVRGLDGSAPADAEAADEGLGKGGAEMGVRASGRSPVSEPVSVPETPLSMSFMGQASLASSSHSSEPSPFAGFLADPAEGWGSSSNGSASGGGSGLRTINLEGLSRQGSSGVGPPVDWQGHEQPDDAFETGQGVLLFRAALCDGEGMDEAQLLWAVGSLQRRLRTTDGKRLAAAAAFSERQHIVDALQEEVQAAVSALGEVSEEAQTLHRQLEQQALEQLVMQEDIREAEGKLRATHARIAAADAALAARDAEMTTLQARLAELPAQPPPPPPRPTLRLRLLGHRATPPPGAGQGDDSSDSHMSSPWGTDVSGSDDESEAARQNSGGWLRSMMMPRSRSVDSATKP
ncbi:hypothetical protein WJX81_002007 [Elliptochloris bilobata]|uniref:Uncharacterized protein n=1 Tax=Elliptochloris bilobata TaxID=381761 RepID=A0AAW1RXJ6_9CHLO